MNSKQLTNGEKILLARRRRGKSQQEAAEEYGVSRYCLRQWERGEPAEKDPPKVSLGRVEPHELCFILRMRNGITLRELAAELDLSRWWICKMEYGKANPDRLIEHWGLHAKPWRPALATC